MSRTAMKILQMYYVMCQMSTRYTHKMYYMAWLHISFYCILFLAHRHQVSKYSQGSHLN